MTPHSISAFPETFAGHDVTVRRANGVVNRVVTNSNRGSSGNKSDKPPADQKAASSKESWFPRCGRKERHGYSEVDAEVNRAPQATTTVCHLSSAKAPNMAAHLSKFHSRAVTESGNQVSNEVHEFCKNTLHNFEAHPDVSSMDTCSKTREDYVRSAQHAYAAKITAAKTAGSRSDNKGSSAGKRTPMPEEEEEEEEEEEMEENEAEEDGKGEKKAMKKTKAKNGSSPDNSDDERSEMKAQAILNKAMATKAAIIAAANAEAADTLQKAQAKATRTIRNAQRLAAEQKAANFAAKKGSDGNGLAKTSKHPVSNKHADDLDSDAENDSSDGDSSDGVPAPRRKAHPKAHPKAATNNDVVPDASKYLAVAATAKSNHGAPSHDCHGLAEDACQHPNSVHHISENARNGCDDTHSDLFQALLANKMGAANGVEVHRLRERANRVAADVIAGLMDNGCDETTANAFVANRAFKAASNVAAEAHVKAVCTGSVAARHEHKLAEHMMKCAFHDHSNLVNELPQLTSKGKRDSVDAAQRLAGTHHKNVAMHAAYSMATASSHEEHRALQDLCAEHIAATHASRGVSSAQRLQEEVTHLSQGML